MQRRNRLTLVLTYNHINIDFIYATNYGYRHRSGDHSEQDLRKGMGSGSSPGAMALRERGAGQSQLQGGHVGDEDTAAGEEGEAENPFL